MTVLARLLKAGMLFNDLGIPPKALIFIHQATLVITVYIYYYTHLTLHLHGLVTVKCY